MAVKDARRRYEAAHPRSRALAAEAAAVLPGGNTRSVLDFAPYPFRVASAHGAYIEDVDGHRYVDLLGNYSAGLLGHDPAPVRDAVTEVLESGWSLGAVHEREARFAQLVVSRFPSVEQVRFTNSGTEANLMAIATALHVTGRSKVVVCNGGYHGGVLYFGPTGAPLLVPHDWVRIDFNDALAVTEAFARHGEEIGCVLVEPMLGASGCIPAHPAFLEALRTATHESGAILIFDEVMTSRLARGGAQEMLGITPDMTTLGKYLAGGLGFGAFGGRKDVMAAFSSDGGSLTHGGTFNNNAFTMTAGVAAMEHVATPGRLTALNARGDQLRARLNEVFAAAAVPMSVTGWGSLMTVHAVAGRVRSPTDLTRADDSSKELFFLEMLEAGFYLARRGYIALSLDITDDHAGEFVAAVADWVQRRTELLT